MEKFLLSLAARYYNKDFVEYALDFTKSRNASLCVLFVLDSEVTSSIMNKLVDTGFIGERPSAELKDAVLNEYENQAKEQIDQIIEIAKSKKVEVQTIIKKGDFVEETVTNAINNAVDLIILNRERQGPVLKLLKSSPVDKLINNSPCEVKVFES